MKPRKEVPAKRNTRAIARRLFPTWPRHKLAAWVLARLRVDGGTYRFPVGAKHFETEIPHFLRTLPPGPPLEIVDSPFDKRVRGVRLVAGLVSGRKR